MTKQELSNLIIGDLKRVYGAEGKKSLIMSIIKNPGFRYIFIIRKCFYYREKNKALFLIYYLLLRHYQYKYTIQMSYKTKIGRGFYFGGINSITINCNTEFGENVNVLKGVLIGYNPRGKNKGCPVIGNKVWIGPNSVIVGKITVGDNVIIAPGAFVNFNVPDNCIVIGNPAKVVKRDQNVVNDYINYQA